MTDIAAVASRLVDLEHKRAMLDEQIADLKAQLVDAIEVGGAVCVGDVEVYRVAPGRRTFRESQARAVLPHEVQAAITIPRLDGAALKRQFGESLWEACCTQGEPFLTAVKR